jgi:hypothetical protein
MGFEYYFSFFKYSDTWERGFQKIDQLNKLKDNNEIRSFELLLQNKD